MSRECTYHCDLCGKEIFSNNRGYTIRVQVKCVGCFGWNHNYRLSPWKEVDACTECVKELVEYGAIGGGDYGYTIKAITKKILKLLVPKK